MNTPPLNASPVVRHNGLLRQRARDLARPLPKAVAAERSQDLLIFRMGDTRFALDLAIIREVVRTGEISALPAMPPCMPGILNVRGRLVALMDLAMLLKFRDRPSVDLSHVIICSGDNPEIGFLVGHVDSIRRQPATAPHPSPASPTDTAARCTAGVTADEVVLLEGQAIMREAARAINGDKADRHAPHNEGGGPA